MAQGEAKLFRDFPLKANKGDYSDTDTYAVVFLSDTYASVDIDATNPQLSNYTATSGGNIPAQSNLSNFTITRVLTTITFDADDLATFLKDALNPTDARTILVINATSVNDDTLQIFDATTDGTTPLDLVNNDLTFTFGAQGISQILLT